MNIRCKEFKCPDCGGHSFGTTNAHDWANAVGNCHGLHKDGSKCIFTWDRVMQDSEVFTDEII